MTRAKFLWASVLGLVGLKAVGQEIPTCKTAGAAIRWNGKKWTCYEPDPAKGEEYCPLGHSQKPGTMMVLYTSGEYLGVFWPVDAAPGTAVTVQAERVVPKVCSRCGIVYVPPTHESK